MEILNLWQGLQLVSTTIGNYSLQNYLCIITVIIIKNSVVEIFSYDVDTFLLLPRLNLLGLTQIKRD